MDLGRPEPRRSTRRPRSVSSFSYVPTDYVAGGRTTAIAIAPTCKPGDCKLYITPAGGGIWRTKNALTGQPNWEYLGGPLGINAAGAVTIDPNDPSGKHDLRRHRRGEHLRLRLRRRRGRLQVHDGGDTWTGPLGGGPTDTGNPLAGKGVGEIVVKPGSPNTIYVGTTTALRGMSEVCCSGVTRPVPGAAKWGLYKSTERRPDVELHPQRLDQRRRLHGKPRGVHQYRDVLPARRPARRSSTRRTLRSSTPARTRAASGARPTAARRGRRSSRPSTPP